MQRNTRKPFIKKFQTSRNKYIYDINSNQIIQVDEIVYDIIEDVLISDANLVGRKFGHKYPVEEIILYYKEIKRINEEFHYFSTHEPVIFSSFRSIGDLKSVLESYLRQIILEVTTSCNLRCKYCTFSGRYSPKTMAKTRICH